MKRRGICIGEFQWLMWSRKLFHLFLNKQDFKFSSGHFIAYKVDILNICKERGFENLCMDTTIM